MKNYISNLLILLLLLTIIVISIIFGFKSNKEKFSQSNEIHVFNFYTDYCNACDYFTNNIWNKMVKDPKYTDIYFYKRNFNDNVNDNLDNSNQTYKSKYNLIQTNRYPEPIIMLVFNNNNYFYDYENRNVSESNIIKWISSITNRIATPINWKEINTPY